MTEGSEQSEERVRLEVDVGEERSTSTQVQGKAQQAAQQVSGQVQERAQQAKEQVAPRAREEVDRRSTQAGEQVRSTADAIRKTGEELRNRGNESQAKVAEQAAERAERLGGYLVEADADRILRDIENFGRRRPWVLAGAGAVLGFAASRFLKASSSRRYEEFEGSWTASARPGLEPGTGADVGAAVDVETPSEPPPRATSTLA